MWPSGALMFFGKANNKKIHRSNDSFKRGFQLVTINELLLLFVYCAPSPWIQIGIALFFQSYFWSIGCDWSLGSLGSRLSQKVASFGMPNISRNLWGNSRYIKSTTLMGDTMPWVQKTILLLICKGTVTTIGSHLPAGTLRKRSRRQFPGWPPPAPMAANSLHSREQPPSRTTPSAKNWTFDAYSTPQAHKVSSRFAKTDFGVGPSLIGMLPRPRLRTSAIAASMANLRFNPKQIQKDF